MRKLTTIVLAGMMLTATLAYASGDLIVDGNLGVGTTSPEVNLHVKGVVSRYTLVQVESAGGAGLGYGAILSLINTDGSGAEFRMADSGSGTAYDAEASYLAISTPAGYGIKLNTNSTDNNGLRITASGNVGIGTATPESRLQAIGSFSVNSKYDPTGGVYYSSAVNGLIIGNYAGSPWPGVNSLYVGGTIYSPNNLSTTSDAKFKKNLLPIDTPLDKILNLNGLSYEWKIDEFKDKNFSEGRHYGVIAQEIEKVLPEVVNTDAKGEKSVAYTEIIPVLIEAIKEQQKIIKDQQKEIQEIRSLVSKQN